MTTNSSSTFDINSLLIKGEYILKDNEFNTHELKHFPSQSFFLSLLLWVISIALFSIIISPPIIKTPQYLAVVSLFVLWSLSMVFATSTTQRFLRAYTIYSEYKKFGQTSFTSKIYWTNIRLIMVEGANWYKTYFYKNFDYMEIRDKKFIFATDGKIEGLEFESTASAPIQTFQWLSAHIAGNDAQFTHTYHFEKSQKKNSLKKSWAIAHRKRLLKKV
jgi:hypothetical protein